MNRSWVWIAAVAVAAGGCLWFVLSEQYASGNVYEEYSSQRTDRMGTAALYEALGRGGLQVGRNEAPLRSLGVRDAEVLILGLSPWALGADYLDELAALANRGNRVVVGLNSAEWVFDYTKIDEPLQAKWGVRIVDSRKADDSQPDADKRAREFVEFSVAPGSGWKRGENRVTRDFGKGSITLIGGSWPFTNLALRENRDISVVTDTIGNSRRIVFDETHLGTVQTGTVMGLVRQFRLQGVLAITIVCALLFIWQSSAPFPPERMSAESETQLAAASAGEGLLNLLMCHIPVNRIVGACVAEWRKDRGRLAAPDLLARMELIAAQKAHPVEQWREIRALLDKKPK